MLNSCSVRIIASVLMSCLLQCSQVNASALFSMYNYKTTDNMLMPITKISILPAVNARKGDRQGAKQSGRDELVKIKTKITTSTAGKRTDYFYILRSTLNHLFIDEKIISEAVSAANADQKHFNVVFYCSIRPTGMESEGAECEDFRFIKLNPPIPVSDYPSKDNDKKIGEIIKKIPAVYLH
ncbi:MAG: hypothetical protein HRU20_22825 [Pseudomonadales bacterium]|nr:hypothetical protein [Pseudomonadales bacterium]